MSDLRALLTAYTARLARAQVDSPRLSAEVLLAHAMGFSRNDLIKTLLLTPEKPVEPNAEKLAEGFIARRERGEPVAYIVGIKEFYGRDFAVSSATLIPRPETETLVEEALTFAARYPSGNRSFLDLGTGSGAIAVTMALELPAWNGVAVDISEEALEMAKKNAANLNVMNLVFYCCNFLGKHLPPGPYGMVLSNPPYVSESEYGALSQEVAGYEPKTALVPPSAHSNGLEHLFAILAASEHLLVPGGILLMEMGCTQGDALLQKAASSRAWETCGVTADLAGLPRVFRAVRR